MTFPLINDWQQKSWENSLHSHCVPSFLKLIFTTASSPDVSTRDFPGKRQHPGQVTEKKEELLLFSADLPSGQLNWFVSLSLSIDFPVIISNIFPFLQKQSRWTVGWKRKNPSPIRENYSRLFVRPIAHVKLFYSFREREPSAQLSDNDDDVCNPDVFKLYDFV